MDFGFSEEQEMLRQSVREFLDAECPMTFVRQMMDDERGYSDDQWKKMAGLGGAEAALSTRARCRDQQGHARAGRRERPLGCRGHRASGQVRRRRVQPERGQAL